MVIPRFGDRIEAPLSGLMRFGPHTLIDLPAAGTHELHLAPAAGVSGFAFTIG